MSDEHKEAEFQAGLRDVERQLIAERESEESGVAKRSVFNRLVMRLPPEIERGKPYWKKRQRELLIMQVMGRATKPHTGWQVYQKVRRFSPMSGEEICELMAGLATDGYLRIVGNDDDCGYKYTLPDA